MTSITTTISVNRISDLFKHKAGGDAWIYFRSTVYIHVKAS